MPSIPSCRHLSLVVEGNEDGDGYRQPEWTRRVAATSPSGRFPKDAPKKESESHKLTFPAPLALPEDELSFDPACPPQSVRSWALLKERNKATLNRKTVYVARPPSIPQNMSVMTSWATPTLSGKGQGKKTPTAEPSAQPPQFDDIADYLHAFYHGIEVKVYRPDLCFQSWDTPRSKTNKASSVSAVGLQQTPSLSCTRIRVRPSPDGLFLYQLNLDDLLDATIEILPDDAYALLLIVDQDLYEDEDDDFCCGRAYGGSRVAVVSSARYNPFLHETSDIDREHMWPASHCREYLARLRNESEDTVVALSPDESGALTRRDEPNPMRAAVAAFQAARSSDPEHLYGLWLLCVARTVSHELGHCFGMDHCVYYACVMQGTASVAEDCRQPPYLCPVCATKLVRTVKEASATPDFDEKQHTRETNEAMARLCEKWKGVSVWAGYGAWLRAGLGKKNENDRT